MSPLVELAEKILANAKTVDEYAIRDESLDSYSDEHLSAKQIPPEVTKARLELLDASEELKKKAQYPESALLHLFYGVCVLAQITKLGIH